MKEHDCWVVKVRHTQPPQTQHGLDDKERYGIRDRTLSAFPQTRRSARPASPENLPRTGNLRTLKEAVTPAPRRIFARGTGTQLIIPAAVL